MVKYINHSFDPANIEYMKDAMLLPYPTTSNNKNVVFQDTVIINNDEIPSTNIELKHILLKLHTGLTHRISQKELNLLRDTQQVANLS